MLRRFLDEVQSPTVLFLSTWSESRGESPPESPVDTSGTLRSSVPTLKTGPPVCVPGFSDKTRTSVSKRRLPWSTCFRVVPISRTGHPFGPSVDPRRHRVKEVPSGPLHPRLVCRREEGSPFLGTTSLPTPRSFQKPNVPASSCPCDLRRICHQHR